MDYSRAFSWSGRLSLFCKKFSRPYNRPLRHKSFCCSCYWRLWFSPWSISWRSCSGISGTLRCTVSSCRLQSPHAVYYFGDGIDFQASWDFQSNIQQKGLEVRTIFKTSYDPDINLFKDRFHRLCYVLLCVVLILFPFFLNEYFIGELTLTLIWAIAGMGLMILVGQSGQVSLGHSAFMATGAYSVVILQSKLGLPFILALPSCWLNIGSFRCLNSITYY